MSEEERSDPSVAEAAKAEARQKYAGRDLKGLVMEMAEWKRRKEEIDKEVNRINAFYDVLRYELVPSKMDETGTENVRYDGIGRVSLTPDLFVSTKVGAKDGLFGWLRKHKLADLIQPSINSSTLKAFVKGRMKAGKPVPTDFLNVTPVTRASITKT